MTQHLRAAAAAAVVVSPPWRGRTATWLWAAVQAAPAVRAVSLSARDVAAEAAQRRQQCGQERQERGSSCRAGVLSRGRERCRMQTAVQRWCWQGTGAGGVREPHGSKRGHWQTAGKKRKTAAFMQEGDEIREGNVWLARRGLG